MAASHAHSKTFRLQELADFIKTYVSLGLAVEKLLERFFRAHHLICSTISLTMLMEAFLAEIFLIEKTRSVKRGV